MCGRRERRGQLGEVPASSSRWTSGEAPGARQQLVADRDNDLSFCRPYNFEKVLSPASLLLAAAVPRTIAVVVTFPVLCLGSTLLCTLCFQHFLSCQRLLLTPPTLSGSAPLCSPRLPGPQPQSLVAPSTAAPSLAKASHLPTGAPPICLLHGQALPDHLCDAAVSPPEALPWRQCSLARCAPSAHSSGAALGLPRTLQTSQPTSAALLCSARQLWRPPVSLTSYTCVLRAWQAEEDPLVLQDVGSCFQGGFRVLGSTSLARRGLLT